MTDPHFQSVLILADESANWKIGGLRQLDRLLLALNELAIENRYQEKIDIFIFWKPEIETSARWLPSLPQLNRVQLTESPYSGSCILATCLFVARDGLAEFFRTTSVARFEGSNVELMSVWPQLSQRFDTACRSAIGESWRFLNSTQDIWSSETQLLRRSGKSQDGPVARFVNRPISRAVTRLLLRFPITPTAWTISICVLPILSAVFVLHGSYASILIGTLLFHVHSVFDGCDGEIARAKYLESREGGRIDDLCDVFAAIIFVASLGLGIGRWLSPSSQFFPWAAEGLLCAALIATNEWLLRLPGAQSHVASTVLASSLYPRHREVIQHSGLLVLGEKTVWWLLQLTKRDVGILFFVLLALAGWPQWIIHSWLAVTVISLALTISARLRSI
ncbi:MAG: hypothetical protein DME75_00650 [Verrucomicrobia bacterium]|nr:MAG: hypothetical protein DME75_00650 [Verrucomicrobiota bacterium]